MGNIHDKVDDRERYVSAMHTKSMALVAAGVLVPFLFLGFVVVMLARSRRGYRKKMKAARDKRSAKELKNLTQKMEWELQYNGDFWQNHDIPPNGQPPGMPGHVPYDYFHNVDNNVFASPAPNAGQYPNIHLPPFSLQGHPPPVATQPQLRYGDPSLQQYTSQGGVIWGQQWVQSPPVIYPTQPQMALRPVCI